MNVSKIVSAALKQLGVLAAGENASGEEVADAIEALQDILSQWATHKLYVHKSTTINIPLSKGRNTYLVGKIEGDCCEYELTCCGELLARPDITAEIADPESKAEPSTPTCVSDNTRSPTAAPRITGVPRKHAAPMTVRRLAANTDFNGTGEAAVSITSSV